MKYFFQKIDARLRTITTGETGASLVEYSLLIALIAIVALVAIRFFGSELSTAYSDIGQQVADNS
jgi:Flp pilus assembly pilin Flp